MGYNYLITFYELLSENMVSIPLRNGRGQFLKFNDTKYPHYRQVSV